MDTKEFNVISLYGVKKLIEEIYKKPNKTFKENYQNIALILEGTAKESMQNIIINSTADLSLEVMCLTKECFGSGGVNSTKEVNDMLKTIKASLTSDFTSMNGERFLKLFRDSIVHKSKENMHVKSEDFGDFNFELQKNKLGETDDFDVSTLNLINYMINYDQARKLDKKFATLEFDKDLTVDVNSMLSAKKKYSKFKNFIQVFNDKGQQIEIDNYQENAYLRFLLKYRKFDTKLKNFDYFKMRFFPHKDNKLNNYELKNRLLCGLLQIYLNIDTKINDLVKYYQNNDDVCGMFCFLDEETILSTIYSSICFSIFSSRSNDELYDLLSEAGCEIKEDVVRHLRNSFIHGRYFYNFKNGFEIYDGTTELNHYTTFTYDQINKLYSVYSKANIDLIKKARTELRLKQMLEEFEEKSL